MLYKVASDRQGQQERRILVKIEAAEGAWAAGSNEDNKEEEEDVVQYSAAEGGEGRGGLHMLGIPR